jgi:hypothetical protein
MDGYGGLNLYWGDLHCHVREWRSQRTSSGEMGGLHSPFTLDEVYDFGQRQSGLDFVAITDHDSHFIGREWEQTQEAAARRTEPGRFVAFLGYEWSHVAGEPSGDWGHRNVIYRGTDGPLLRCDREETNTAPKLWAALKEQVPVADCLVIPHHPARAASEVWWNLDQWDADLERLVEVYSLWGSSEKSGPPYEIHYLREHSPTGRGEAPGHFVQDALARGYRFGLVAGSESHDGRPGNPLFHGPFKCGVEVCYRGGIQGTWAGALDRDSLFDACRARHCFGTTGAKIVVEFSVNGALMGEELAATAEREVLVRASGTDVIARVEIVRNNEDIHTVVADAARVEVGWMDRDREGGDTYYARVTQADGHMAWSSPVWVG